MLQQVFFYLLLEGLVYLQLLGHCRDLVLLLLVVLHEVFPGDADGAAMYGRLSLRFDRCHVVEIVFLL